jgi:sugar phosphate isomerase/epimerase
MSGDPGGMRHSATFGCNTYSYVHAYTAAQCVERLADQGFVDFEIMVYPAHLWASDTGGLRALKSVVQSRGLRIVTLNMPNIDINIAAAAEEMRAYSLALLEGAVRMAGELGASGVIIGPGKANPLFPCATELLIGHFFAALDCLMPVAARAGTALWLENMPFAFLPDARSLIETLDRYGGAGIGVVYDVANAHFIGEAVEDGIALCRDRLKLVHLSDTGREIFRHDPVGCGTVPFARLPALLRQAGYSEVAMLEIIGHDADRVIAASAEALVAMGFGHVANAGA